MTAEYGTTDTTTDMTAEQIQELRNLLSAAQRDAEVQRRALSMFKEQVREVAIQKGEENDLCSVLDDALEELGLEGRSPRSASGYLTVRIRVTDITPYANHRSQVRSANWLRSSLRLEEVTVSGDSDINTDEGPNVQDWDIVSFELDDEDY